MDKPKCVFFTKSGKPCPNDALDGDEHEGGCFAHSPALEDVRKEARRKGGRKSKYPSIDEVDATEMSPDEAIKRISQLIRTKESGSMSEKTVKQVTNLYGVLRDLYSIRDRIGGGGVQKIVITYVNDWRGESD